MCGSAHCQQGLPTFPYRNAKMAVEMDTLPLSNDESFSDLISTTGSDFADKDFLMKSLSDIFADEDVSEGAIDSLASDLQAASRSGAMPNFSLASGLHRSKSTLKESMSADEWLKSELNGSTLMESFSDLVPKIMSLKVSSTEEKKQTDRKSARPDFLGLKESSLSLRNLEHLSGGRGRSEKQISAGTRARSRSSSVQSRGVLAYSKGQKGSNSSLSTFLKAPEKDTAKGRSRSKTPAKERFNSDTASVSSASSKKTISSKVSVLRQRTAGKSLGKESPRRRIRKLDISSRRRGSCNAAIVPTLDLDGDIEPLQGPELARSKSDDFENVSSVSRVQSLSKRNSRKDLKKSVTPERSLSRSPRKRGSRKELDDSQRSKESKQPPRKDKRRNSLTGCDTIKDRGAIDIPGKRGSRKEPDVGRKTEIVKKSPKKIKKHDPLRASSDHDAIPSSSSSLMSPSGRPGLQKLFLSERRFDRSACDPPGIKGAEVCTNSLSIRDEKERSTPKSSKRSTKTKNGKSHGRGTLARNKDDSCSSDSHISAITEIKRVPKSATSRKSREEATSTATELTPCEQNHPISPTRTKREYSRSSSLRSPGLSVQKEKHNRPAMKARREFTRSASLRSTNKSVSDQVPVSPTKSRREYNRSISLRSPDRSTKSPFAEQTLVSPKKSKRAFPRSESLRSTLPSPTKAKKDSSSRSLSIRSPKKNERAPVGSPGKSSRRLI